MRVPPAMTMKRSRNPRACSSSMSSVMFWMCTSFWVTIWLTRMASAFTFTA